MRNSYLISINLFLLLHLFSTSLYGQGLTINEFMSDNETTILDKDYEFSDWLELYNNSNDSINMLNYYLSDDYKELKKWKFPNFFLAPHGFIIVFASGKNKLDTNEFHTNFKISSIEEGLYLSNNSGEIICQVESLSLVNDEVYVQYPDGSGSWYKSDNPTPKSKNVINNQLMFSAEGGFYSSPINLNITSLFGDTVYFTLDGSEPTESSAIFTNPLLLDYKYSSPNYFCEIPTSPDQSLIGYKAWESPSVNIDKANILRCASYKDGERTSKIYTQTYFIDSTIIGKYDIPVISLISSSENLFNDTSGIYVPGIYYDPDDANWTGNYFQEGDNWEKPVHIEYYKSNGEKCFSQDAGLRIHGSRTRQSAQKSLRLYARNEYGDKYFNYWLLPHRSNNKYERFVLQSTMGIPPGSTIVKDVLVNEIVRFLYIEYQDYQPVVVFINGEYWGIHTIRDVIDERYIAYVYGLNEDSIDLITPGRMVFAGSSRNYTKLTEFIRLNDLSIDSNYNYVKTQMDVDNYIDYQIAEMFFANYDWPANNSRLWRPQTLDGKWRWIYYDLGYSFWDDNYNMLIHASLNDSNITGPNPPYSTFLFRNLLKNYDFSNQFINRYAELLNMEFTSYSTTGKLGSIMQLYDNEVSRHIDRWNDPGSYSEWLTDCEKYLSDFLKNRPCVVEENIMDFFNLTEFGFTCGTGIIEKLTGKFVIAPNPSNGVFSLINNYPELINGDLTITDLSGKIIYKDNNMDVESGSRKIINLNDRLNGFYILTISVHNEIERHKILVIK